MAPYQHLLDKVSATCLERIREEIKRMNRLGDDEQDSCGCVLRTTKGLICDCSIQISIRVGQGLYLDEIHVFWKILEIGDGVDQPEIVERALQDMDNL